MRILLDTTPLTNQNASRGIGAYTRNLATELEKIEEIDLRFSTQSQPKKDFKPDLIHYPYFDLFFSTLPILKTKPKVVTVHDVIPLIFSEHYPAGFKGRLKLKKQKLALKTVDALITDSESSKKDIAQYLGINLDKIYVTYLAGNPAITHKTLEEVREIREKYHLPAHYLLYVGDINFNKNLPQLIKALKHLPRHVHLVFLGRAFIEQDIPEWKWITAQIALSDVSKRVHFFPRITGDADDELSAIYSGALAYVQPSLYEGFGLPVLEAMQAKTPVICANNSSLLEVGKGHCVFVEPEAEEIAQAVELIESWDTDKRKRIIQHAHAWSQTFSWQKTAQETVKVYQKVLQAK